MNDEHFQSLLDRYFDQRLDPDSQAELECELLSRREAREEFWRRAHLEEALRTNIRESAGGTRLQLGSVPPSSRQRNWPRLTALAAAAAFLAGGAWFSLQSRHAGPPQASSPAPPPISKVATVERTASARWSGGAPNLDPSGPVNLESGLASLRFFGGTRLSLEGPARLTPMSEHAMNLSEGFAQFDVPAVARTFTVALPSAEVVSEGGAFEVRLGSDGQAAVGVTRGTLKVRSAAREARTLAAGETWTIRPDGSMAEDAGFPPNRRQIESEIDRLLDRNQSQRLASWRAASVRRDQDPALLVHLRLDHPSETGGMLVNSARHPAATQEAVVISADRVEGRWPGKTALAFRNFSDRARVGIEGSYPQVTFAAWVRIDELANHFNAIVFSEPLGAGTAHWQLSDKAEFRFGVQPKKTLPGQIFLRSYSGPVIREEERGTWKLLASTYDADLRVAVNYVDGREISRVPIEQSVPIHFGIATIGNCPVPPLDTWGARTFGGAIDELLIYGRILSAGEIQGIFEEGRSD